MVAGFQVIQGVLYRLRGVVKGCYCPGKGCREEVSSPQPQWMLGFALDYPMNRAGKGRLTADDDRASVGICQVHAVTIDDRQVTTLRVERKSACNECTTDDEGAA